MENIGYQSVISKVHFLHGLKYGTRILPVGFHHQSHHTFIDRLEECLTHVSTNFPSELRCRAFMTNSISTWLTSFKMSILEKARYIKYTQDYPGAASDIDMIKRKRQTW